MAKSDAPILADSLADLSSDLLSLAMQLNQVEDPGPVEPFRQRLKERLEALQRQAQEASIPSELVDLTRYALVALLDEIVLTSSWPLKNQWLGRPLQMEYFNDFSAGEEFYVKLQGLQGSSDPARLDVLEVYYLCLCCGFKGKHGGMRGMETLKKLQSDLAQELSSGPRKHGGKAKAKKGGAGALSPRWKPSESATPLTKQLPLRVVVVLCLALLVILYITFATLLSQSALQALTPLG